MHDTRRPQTLPMRRLTDGGWPEDTSSCAPWSDLYLLLQHDSLFTAHANAVASSPGSAIEPLMPGVAVRISTACSRYVLVCSSSASSRSRLHWDYQAPADTTHTRPSPRLQVSSPPSPASSITRLMHTAARLCHGGPDGAILQRQEA